MQKELDLEMESFLVLQGATIRKDEATGAVIVARIMRGGAADRSGEFVEKYLSREIKEIKA